MVAIGVIAPLLPIPGNYQILTVLSGSMEPAIKTGSIVVTKPVDQYKINDIITFINPQKKNESITHRIVDMKVVEGNILYKTQGDANNASDSRKVQQKEIIGKVLFDIPYLGYAVNEARKPLGFALIIILPALIIIGDELRKVWKEIMKLKNKKKDTEQDKQIKKLKKEVEELENKIKK